ncbi:Phenylalanine--tRNA ligase beta subunit [Hondaea fermentalgiana]|uniref:phenylalanine--tRNA ligase n=1 Tax=Hondaea fermentalgiana TaxID=2315210 RepID=A0A2R5GJC7_9STRA|nr:Phenylalanine--tRNA ligase beta subunit [Hondaea fermentalgiana]|eukprot:GBG30990.1 Phenylalanine--tRNA ligase beta subunit [Hondaea fermentalgiana]
MPVVSVKRDSLFRELGKEYTEEEFDQLCFDYGIELDDVEEEEGEVIYKIDIPANRYDLLCLEGLARALNVFNGNEKLPVFKTVAPADPGPTRITVHKETQQIRPFVVSAVLRGLNLTEESYRSCLDLQDQLHRNLCRRRTLVAIGTHDLDNIEGPFTYEALAPEDIRFVHLFETKEMNAREILDDFRVNPERRALKPYTDIIYDSPVYPVIYDKNRQVVSLPPIINGSVSKMSKDTKNMFIECTATDMTKAKIVLNTIVAMFARYCDTPECVETVDVVYNEPVLPGGSTEPISNMTCPDLSTRAADADVARVQSTIGAEVPAQDMRQLVERMQLGPATLNDDETVLTVTVPVTRSDILHEVDIAEDIAIAYGYNNIVKTVPVSHRPGKELPVNLLSDLLRYEISRQGYMECMTLGLCSLDENFKYLNREDPGNLAVTLANPKTIEFQCVRTSLLPGVVKTLGENMSLKISEGIRLFEVSDVVLRDPRTPGEKDIGCRNERHLAALHAGLASSFETIHGLVDRIMQVLSVVPAKEYCPEAHDSSLVQTLISDGASIGEYKLVSRDEDRMFFPGRGATIMWKPHDATEYTELGSFGVLHVEVLQNFSIPFPCTVLEMTIEPFVRE